VLADTNIVAWGGALAGGAEDIEMTSCGSPRVVASEGSAAEGTAAAP
jgi:hypothetical protein